MDTEPPPPEKDIRMDALCELTAKTQCPNLGKHNRSIKNFYFYF